MFIDVLVKAFQHACSFKKNLTLSPDVEEFYDAINEFREANNRMRQMSDTLETRFSSMSMELQPLQFHSVQSRERHLR